MIKSLLIFLLLTPLILHGEEYGGQGEIVLEFRQFEADSNDKTLDSNLSLFTRLEATYESDFYKHVLRGGARVDNRDQNRNFIIIEDAYASMILDQEGEYSLLAGYKLFNWTALEAFHPVDIINSRNFDSNLENLEKKGELTLEFEIPMFEGTLNFYYFPKFEEPEYPGERSRLGAGVNVDRSVVVDGADTKSNNFFTTQYGVRLTQNIFDSDFSVHYLKHIDRNMPVFGTDDYNIVLGNYIPTSNEVVPFFYPVTQVGGTAQLSLGDFLVKFEYANRKFDEKASSVVSSRSILLKQPALERPVDHSEMAMGLEYIFNLEGGQELNLFAETNTVLGVSEAEKSKVSVFQQDFMVGVRWSLNDLMGREFYATVIGDFEHGSEWLFNTSYNQRISDNWKYYTGFRYISATPADPNNKKGLENFDGSGYLYFNIARFF